MQKEAQAIKLNYVREHNLKLICSLLRKQPLSCLELSREIGISDVGVRKIVKQMEMLNMVQTVSGEEFPRKKGNQHIRYTLNPERGLFLIIDFTHMHDKFAVFDFAGNHLYEEVICWAAAKVVTPEDLYGLIEHIKQSFAERGIEQSKLLNVVLSVPGQVDEASRCFTISHRFINWENDMTGGFYRIFEDAFSVPVIAKNNVALMLLGEAEAGFSSADSPTLYLFVGYGVASAIMYRGEIITGHRGYAGEIGGNSYAESGTLSLNTSIVRQIDKCEPYLRTKDFEGLLEAYGTSPEVKEIVMRGARFVGMEIYNISSLLGVDAVILGGEALQFGQEYIDEIRAYVQKRAVTGTVTQVKIHTPTIKDAAVCGALALAEKHSVEYLIRGQNESEM